MENYQFSVDLGGMISILSDHLYSSPDVFLRELIQNSADAVNMRKKYDSEFTDGEINISVEENERIIFQDNGIGLTEEEIHKFVSVIGQSSKRDDNGGFIGKFGIGLLSCFIVTDEIVLRSRSAKCPEKVVEWHGFSDGRYSVKETGYDMPIGTEISFSSVKGYEEYFSSDYLEEKSRYYALPLPYPIYVSKGDNFKIRTNILFAGNGSDSRSISLETGKRVFEMEKDFVDVIPLESPTGLFSGVAYILPFTVSAMGSNNRHRIYLKNMLLTEDGSSLLPEWSFFLRCIINTKSLRPTASREDFFRDSMLEKAKNEIAVCISDYMERISLNNPSLLEKIVSLHGVALRSVACDNERIFRIFMPYFTFETSFGIISGRDLMEYGKTIFYITDTDVFRQLVPIFSQKNILLVNTSYVHSKPLLMFAAELGIADIQPLRENIIEESLGDCPDSDKYEVLLKYFSDSLKECGCKPVMKCFEPSQLACLYSPNADAELKRDIEYSKENGDSLFSDMLNMFEEEIDNDVSSLLYINSSNDLINRLAELDDSEKLSAFAKILYIQSLIAGGFPVYSKDMGMMNNNLIKLIEWGI